MQIPISFLGEETVRMSPMSNGAATTDRLLNEILETIIFEVLLSSCFWWSNNVIIYVKSMSALNHSVLPTFNFSNGGELGTGSPRRLIKTKETRVILETRHFKTFSVLHVYLQG